MGNKLNLPRMARCMVGISLSLISAVVLAQILDKEEPLRIAPKGTVSLEYPNQWDINKLIALSNDGSRLIDASEAARNIRVWDWEKKEVVQRLLLNEKAPEMNDGNKHWDMVLQSSLGQELALSPDGRMVAACVHINKKMIIQLWSLESGAIVDNISGYQDHVPGLNQELVFEMECNSISFSPDGKHMAILVKSGSRYSNEADYKSFAEMVSSYNIKTGKYKSGMSREELRAQKYYPINISGIALFETHDWKLEKFFYRVSPQQIFNSRPLFDPDNKTVSAVVFDKAPPNPNWHRLGWDEWAGNRIVRWNIATGEQLEDKVLPQLAESPSVGVWWSPLPGTHEVWWQNGFQQRWWEDSSARTLDQTEADAEQCRQAPVPEPSFASDVKSNCAYTWVLTILNLDTGKLKYLAPFKKNAWPTVGSTREQYYSASISPDGAYIVLFRRIHNAKNRLSASSSVEIFNRDALQLEGRYAADIWIDMEPVFSNNAKYFALPFHKSRDSAKSAIVFELPNKNNHHSDKRK